MSFSDTPQFTSAQKLGCFVIASFLLIANVLAFLLSSVPADCPIELAECSSFAFERDFILFGTPAISILIAFVAILWMKRKRP